MYLLIVIFAAVIATALWYKKAPDESMCLGILCWIYWGASIMWLVDVIFEYIVVGSAIFQPSADAMRNDFFLGLSAVALGAVIWIVILLIKDPKGVIREKLFKRDKGRETRDNAAEPH